MDEELFELCKQVYEATKFETGEWFEITENLIVTDEDKYIMEQDTVDTPYDFIPRYTSDYLLEKLPAKLAYNKTEYFYYLEKFGDGSYGSGYGFTDEGGHIDHPMIGVLTDNVALKVNLKLVIALDDAGQLVAAETTA